MSNILFAIDSLHGGGAERVLSTIANQSSRMGHKVSIVLTYSNLISYPVDEAVTVFSIDAEELEHTIVRKPLKPTASHETKPVRQKTFLENMRNEFAERRDFKGRGKKLISLINSLKCDSVISFLTNTNMLLGSIAKNVKAKTIISERSDPNKTVFNLNNGKYILSLYNNVDVIVCQTHDAAKSYAQHIHKKTVVICNPLLGNMPNPYKGLRRKEIITFGRLEPPKNLKLLIDAFYLVHQKHPDYTLRMYGDGSLKEMLISYISSKEIDNCVFISPFQDNIHDIVRDAAMYVSSSDFEGMSNSMLEALSLGMPCICTDCPIGGAREIIQDGENGLLVPVANIEQLAIAMNRIIEDSSLAEKISTNAICIRNLLSPENITQQWLLHTCSL